MPSTHFYVMLSVHNYGKYTLAYIDMWTSKVIKNQYFKCCVYKWFSFILLLHWNYVNITQVHSISYFNINSPTLDLVPWVFTSFQITEIWDPTLNSTIISRVYIAMCTCWRVKIKEHDIVISHNHGKFCTTVFMMVHYLVDT